MAGNRMAAWRLALKSGSAVGGSGRQWAAVGGSGRQWEAVGVIGRQWVRRPNGCRTRSRSISFVTQSFQVGFWMMVCSFVIAQWEANQ